MNKQEITLQVKEKSKELGFDLVGITKPHIIKNKLLDVWLNKNNHASMHINLLFSGGATREATGHSPVENASQQAPIFGGTYS